MASYGKLKKKTYLLNFQLSIAFGVPSSPAQF